MKKIDFNQDWQFKKCAAESKPVNVSLPHDAMLHEKRSASCRNGKTTGYFPGGKYEYSKDFFVPENWRGQSVLLELEGVCQKASVYLNGKQIGWQPYGYTGFVLDLQNALQYGAENTLVVVADNSGEPSTRWYSGSGIYRPVWLYVGNRTHIDVDGIQVFTVSAKPAKVRVKTLTTGGTAHIRIEKEGKAIATATGTDVEIAIPNGSLWSAESPALYTCVVELWDENDVVDIQETTFGICHREWNTGGLYINGVQTKLRGACIHHDNGILGACEYSASAERRVKILKDAGFNAIRMAHNPASKALLRACDRLGLYLMDEFTDMWYEHKNRFDYATYFEEWYERDLTAMVKKDISHPSVLMYSIGNEVTETAEPGGIALTGQMRRLCHQLDATRPVTCGINMALNVMHFAGLGVYQPEPGDPVRPQEPKNPKALEILSRMMDARKARAAGTSGDTTDAGTAALGMQAEAGAKKDGKLVGSEFFNKMMVTMKEQQQEVVKQEIAKILSEDAFAELDIAGYNYATARYVLDAREYPNRISVGTETLPQKIYQNWQQVMACPYSLGDFIWTGWDYIGEAGVGAFCYDSVGTRDKDYPFLLAGSGIIDILGHHRPEVWLNKSVYGLTDAPYIGVEPVTHSLENRIISAWRFSDAVHSWSWEGCEGRKAEIIVYSRAPWVALFRDDILLEKKRTVECQVKFETTYTPGRITAVSYDETGTELGRDELRTAFGKTCLRVTPDKTNLKADGQDLCHLEIDLVGEDGVVKASEDREVTVTVEGAGELAGFGNAAPCTEEIFTDSVHTTYYGRALAIVRTYPEEGPIHIAVRTRDGLEARIVLQSYRA